MTAVPYEIFMAMRVATIQEQAATKESVPGLIYCSLRTFVKLMV